MNLAQEETCKILTLDPSLVTFSNADAVNCKITVNIGADKPYEAYITRNEFGGLKLEDGPATGVELKHDDTHDKEWCLPSVTRDVAKEVDSSSDRARETALRLGHALPVHVADAIVKELSEEHEFEMNKTFRILASGFIQPQTNLKLRAWALAMAAGLECAVGKTMTLIAEELGVTRAAISKETVAWRTMLGLPESRYCKSDEARESYRKERTENHWRRGKS